MLTSTAFIPVNRQSNLTSVYAQHVANIVWSNETLPHYTTRDIVLSPFTPMNVSSPEANETWTGTTQLYSVDVTCENAVFDKINGGVYNSTSGCSYVTPPFITISNNDTTKYFEALYVGYSDENGFADFYLSDACPGNASHTFLIRMAKVHESIIQNSTLQETTPVIQQGESTTLYCQPRYYTQKVNATVTADSQSVLSVVAIGDKEDLPGGMFDINAFEWSMNSAQTENFEARGDYPTIAWPDQKSHFLDTHLDLNYFPKMCAFALACYQRPLVDYMDPVVLARSYEAAYRLLFVRQMSNVLQPNFTAATRTLGTQVFRTQAVVVIPGFTYAVEALLGVIILLASSLLYLTVMRPGHLLSDPSTIASTMSRTADDVDTLKLFEKLDKCDEYTLEKQLRGSTFCLAADGTGQIRLMQANKDCLHTGLTTRGDSERVDNDAGVRPKELRWYSGTIFLTLQIACVASLAYLHTWARVDNGIYAILSSIRSSCPALIQPGIPLPSQSRFVRQLVENYVPIAVSTFIEPFWVVLNKLLCVLQPFEELRKGNAASERSVTLDYHSLPPQFVVWKAVRARHFLLAAACFMSILANALSVAFGGLFYEGDVSKATATLYQPLLSLHVKSLNGNGPPFNSGQYTNWQGGTTQDEFYIAMSNITAGSRLPPWSDDSLFYLPHDLPSATDPSTTFTFVTAAMGSDLLCQELYSSGQNHYFSSEGLGFGISLSYNSSTNINCTQRSGSLIVSNTTHNIGSIYGLNGVSGLSAFEFSVALDSISDHTPNAEAAFCREHIVAGWSRGDIKDITVLDSETQTTMLCRPRLVTGSANVTVDPDGYVLASTAQNLSSDAISMLFTTSPSDLIGQAHLFIIDNGATWHNDSFPSDFINYLMEKMTNTSRLLDPTLSVPSAGETGPQFAALYNKLFAIFLAYNRDLLFASSPPGASAIEGTMAKRETRIFISTPAFFVSQTILGLYIATTLLLYTRRPRRILPRLPTTIASMASFFAASYAIREFKGTANLTARQRREWLGDKCRMWAFGTFLGTDGKAHIGLEMEPFVTILKEGKIPKVGVTRGVKQAGKGKGWLGWKR